MDEKIKALMEQDGFVEKMLACEEPEAVQKLFADNGVELSLEEVKQIGSALDKLDTENGELSEDDLEDVAGGVAVTTVIGVTVAVVTGAIKIGSAIARNWGTIRRFFRRW